MPKTFVAFLSGAAVSLFLVFAFSARPPQEMPPPSPDSPAPAAPRVSAEQRFSECAGEMKRLCPRYTFADCGSLCLVMKGKDVQGSCAKRLPEIKAEFDERMAGVEPAPMKDDLKVCLPDLKRLCPGFAFENKCGGACLRFQMESVSKECQVALRTPSEK